MKKLSERTVRTPLPTDIAYIMSNDGTLEGKVPLSEITDIPETARTINVDNSMTATEIQAEIDSIGKYLPRGSTVTFRFADGTYNLNNQLLFSGFYGDGVINIAGNASDPETLNTTQSVHLNFNNGTHGIAITLCDAFLDVKSLKVTTQDGARGIQYSFCRFGRIRWSYFISTAKTSDGTRGLNALASSVLLQKNYFSGQKFAIFSERTSVVSLDGTNADTGTQPDIGYRANEGGIIMKGSAESITGSISDDQTGSGGVVR